MAKDVKPTAAEKGKGKAVDEKLPNGDGKTDSSKSGIDGKLTNGKKGDEPHEGTLLGCRQSNLYMEVCKHARRLSCVLVGLH